MRFTIDITQKKDNKKIHIYMKHKNYDQKHIYFILLKLRAYLLCITNN